jgi:hypothetical protein
MIKMTPSPSASRLTVRAFFLLLAMAGPVLPQKAAQNRAPTEQERNAALEQIRDYALNYTKRLPNFTCVQITTEDVEYFSPNNIPAGAPSRTVEQQLTYLDYRDSLQSNQD